MTDRLMTLDEVADLTRLPVATLRWMRHDKRGPRAGKLGRRLVYKESDVLAWIDRQFESDGSPAARQASAQTVEPV